MHKNPIRQLGLIAEVLGKFGWMDVDPILLLSRCCDGCPTTVQIKVFIPLSADSNHPHLMTIRIKIGDNPRWEPVCGIMQCERASRQDILADARNIVQFALMFEFGCSHDVVDLLAGGVR
ncbi:MAG: hypothetical protein WCO09_00175 [bacterium]